MIGIEKQLFYAKDNEASNLTGIKALWWDAEELITCDQPVGGTEVATTDANGWIFLNLIDITNLNVGDYGFLLLYQLSDIDHKSSLVFAGKVQTSDIPSGVMLLNEYRDGWEWEKPVDWPALDLPIEGVQKIQGLYSVCDVETGSNSVAFSASGAYTVDWGDGNTEDFATGVTAEHAYDFASVDLGSAIAISGDKIAIITITPQTGQNLTSINFQKKPTVFSGLASGMPVQWKELVINGEFLTSITVMNKYSGTLVVMHALKKVTLGENNALDLGYLFSNCYGLKTALAFSTNTSIATDLDGFLSNNYTLTTVGEFDLSSSVNSLSFIESPLIKWIPNLKQNTTIFSDWPLDLGGLFSVRFIAWMDFSNELSLSYCFAYNFNLLKVPSIDTRNVANAYSFLIGCAKVKTIPSFDFSSATVLTAFFEDCTNLRVAPEITLNTTNDVNGRNMFRDCTLLKEVPFYNFSKISTCQEMFSYCRSLETIPAFDLSNSINLENMFENCTSIHTVPSFTLKSSGITSGMYVFKDCSKVSKMAIFDVTGCSNLSYIFDSCNSLKVLPEFDFSNATVVSTIGGRNLQWGTTTGCSVDIDYSDSALGPEALNDIYSNLAIVTAQTITVTGNWGTISDNPTLLPAGWTLVD